MYGFGYGLTIRNRRVQPPYIGPLDGLTGLYAVHAPRRAFSSYTGPGRRVRRSIDGGEEDIGFDASGWLDTDWLADVAAGGNLTIVREYDQTGQGRDAVQASVANQPRCALAGVVDVGPNGHACAVYDGINDFMEVQGGLGFARNAEALTMAANVRATGSGIQPIAQAYVATSTSARASLSYINGTTVVLQGRATDGAGITTATATVTASAWARIVSRMRYAAASVDIAVDGGAPAVTALSPFGNTPNTDSFALPRIGGSSSVFLTGSLGAVVLSRAGEDPAAFDAALSQFAP